MNNLFKDKMSLAAGALIILLILLVITISVDNKATTSTSDKLVERSHIAFPISTVGDITCTYPQVIQGWYRSDTITHVLPPPETNPLIFTFGDIHEEVSSLKFIDSTPTISEVPIIKLANDNEKIVFIEGDGDPYTTIHTIFKSSGVSLYSKQISLIGIPFTSSAVGHCI